MTTHQNTSGDVFLFRRKLGTTSISLLVFLFSSIIISMISPAFAQGAAFAHDMGSMTDAEMADMPGMGHSGKTGVEGMNLPFEGCADQNSSMVMVDHGHTEAVGLANQCSATGREHETTKVGESHKGGESHTHTMANTHLYPLEVTFTFLIGLLLLGAAIIFFRSLNGTDLMEYSFLKK